MKSFVLMIIICCLLLDDLTRAAGHDFPKITANDPLAVPGDAMLKCHVENLNDSIAWMYNETTAFSCDPPYSAGMCVLGLDYPYDFSINHKENMFMVTFPVQENMNDGNWTCHHGNDTSHPYDLDTGTAPASPNLTLSNMSPMEGENVTLTCTLPTGDVKLTSVNMQTSDRASRTMLMDIEHPTNLTYTYTLTVDCKHITYFCCIYNRFGSKCDRHDKIPANCTVKFLKDLTSPNVTGYEGDSFTLMKFFYNGIPWPEWMWYRLENGTEMSLTNYRFLQTARVQCTPHGTACVYASVFNPIVADSGYYVVHVNASGMTDMYTFHLNILPAQSALSTTKSPPECSAPSTDELTFGQGIGIGIGIGLLAVIFIVGGIYGCRKS